MVWSHLIHNRSEISNSKFALLFAMLCFKLEVVLPFAELVFRAQHGDTGLLLKTANEFKLDDRIG